MLFCFVIKHAWVRETDRRMDGRTNGQNYDPQDRASITASRGKMSINSENSNTADDTGNEGNKSTYTAPIPRPKNIYN